MRRIKVVYLAHDTRDYGGSAMSLLNMISSLGDAIDPLVICREEGPVTEMLRSRGIKYIVYFYEIPQRDNTDHRYWIHFPKLVAWHVRQYRRDVKALVSLLRGYGIDIVHANNSINILGLGLARRLGAKCVCHIREYLWLDHKIRIIGGEWWLHRRIARCDAAIAISTDIARHWCVEPPRGRVIGDAVKSGSDVCIETDKQTYMLMCSAMLSECKGTFFAAEAFLRSGLHRQGYKLRMIGRYTPQIESRLSDLMAEYSADGCIELAGFVSDLTEQYRHATAYIMASEREALGRVTIEAMFNGCPVVARASGGTTDIVIDGMTGHLFDDMDSCVEKIRLVASTPQDKLIRLAADHVAANYSEETFRQKMLDVYTSLLRR